MSNFLLLYCPVEPMEMGYSIQWTEWFTQAFKRNGIDFISLEGRQLVGLYKRQSGFNDPIATFKWKFSQLERVADNIQFQDDPIVIFFQDGWMPGTEAISFIREIGKRDIKVVSYWHGGSYLPADILTGHYWPTYSEVSWIGQADVIFVGSEYHKERIQYALDHHAADDPSIRVVGCPVEVPDWSLAKDKLVVWPHRIDRGKRPDIFDRLAAEPQLKDVAFLKTLEVCKTKDEYYHLLAKAKVAVSTAEHETFGISMVEAAMLGCYPVIPDFGPYKETMETQFRYDSYELLVDLIHHCCEHSKSYEYPFADRYKPESVTDNICKQIKGLFD